jgi:hypothetical protein
VTDIPVRLERHEFVHAATLGVQRQVDNVLKGRTDQHGADERDAWGLHVRGACGELAVAKALNRFWSGALGNLRAADVGPYQVRHTLRQTNGLRLHHADEGVFILVTGDPPNLCVRGWLEACEGKHARFWGDPTGLDRPAFFVPQHLLRPMEDLP